MVTFRQYLLTESANKGDMFEFVFAAACVSRFVDRYDDNTPAPLTPGSIHQVMDKYFTGDVEWTVKGSKNSVDTVTFETARIPEQALASLSLKRYRQSKEVADMVDKAIKAVENPKYSLFEIASKIISNNTSDNVEIRPVGTQDQTGTKSDVDIYINNKAVKRISLKYGSKQLGQFAGTDIKNQIKEGLASVGVIVPENILNPLDNKNLTKKGLIGLYDERDTADSTNDKVLLFKIVNDIFKKISSQPVNIDKVVDGFIKSAQGEEDDIDAILVDGKYIHYITKDYIEAFKDQLKKDKSKVRWKVSNEQSGTENPTIVFTVDNVELFQLRFRFDADWKSKIQKYKLRTRVLLEVKPALYTYVT